ncbi:MAG: acyl-CoA dehydrogenase family protein [Dehalococcoidia bacterium]|nr:acyl-CoA dehydrogenase family protein [Dehalococcoidia bacterium]MDH4367120.1 acyl-CoA dehydrogenase family protein [Dehalococcoidia bacterium]
MDFSFTEEQNRFRKEVRGFLEEEIKRGYWEPTCDAWVQGFDPGFTERVAKRGWIGLTWPKEYGGQDRSHIDRLILTEEMLRYGAPAACHWFGDRQVGGAILSFGSEELKNEFLPRIVKGEAYFGLGMSEPGTGSDLASLQTRAVEDGDYYVINGQKTWTSCASFSEYFDVYVRTDPEAPRHRGISEFIVDAKSPGVSRIPMIDITGTEAWNDVFFDNVRVHKRYLVGEKNRGFYQVLHQLDYERSGMERLMGNYPLFDAIMQFAKENELSKDPVIRSKLAQLQIEFEVGRLLVYRVALVMEEGRAPNWESAMSKAYSTEFEKHVAGVAMEVLGPYGQLKVGSKYIRLRGMALHSYLGSKGYSLQAGTTEILKNILATRRLGLPSS